MARLKWDDNREFPFLNHRDFVRAEASWCEKQFGKNLDAFTWSDSIFASTLVTLRRNGVMLTLADTDEWTVGWLDDRIVIEPGDTPEEGEEPDPTEAAPAPAPTTRRGRSGGQSSSSSSA